MFIWLLAAGSVFRATACGVPCRRAGRETAHGSRGLRGMQWLWSDGGTRRRQAMHAERAAGQGSPAVSEQGRRDEASEAGNLYEGYRSKKKPVPRLGTQAGKAGWRRGSLRGKPSRIDSRDATGWRPAGPCPLATQEATGIVEIRDSLPPKGPGLPAVMPCWADRRAGQSP